MTQQVVQVNGAARVVEPTRHRHASLAEALAAFQAELPKLTKDEKAKVKGETKEGRAYDRSYGYADLAQVVETVLPVLGRHGLSITSKNVFTADGYILKVTLLHESSDSDTGDWPLPDPRRSGPQDIGSAMTYGRRYLTLALSGAYPGGEDDDGAKAQAAPRESWDNAKPASTPPAPAAPVFTDEVISGFHAKILGEPDLTTAVKGYDWMASKDVHKRDAPSTTGDDVRVTANEVLAARLSTEALNPGSTLDGIKQLQTIATDRGLLKVQVSASETLADVLYTAQELAQHEAAMHAKADTPDPQAE